MDHKMKQDYLALIDAVDARLREMSQAIWQRPELGYQEVFACTTLCDFLREHEFEVEQGVIEMETAFIATKGQGSINLVFSVEYDALPGLGHACGHNLFCCSGVGSAVATAKLLDQMDDVMVTVIGSPAEEGGCVTNGSAKVHLARAGAFDTASIALISHADSHNVVQRELVGGAYVEAKFKGRPSHAGGSPEKGINALTAGTLTITNVNAIRQQFERGNVVNPIITQSSQLSNSIPESCDLKINIRATNAENLYKLMKTVENCVKAAALVTGCEYEYTQVSMPTEELTPNDVLGDACADMLRAFGKEIAPNDSMNYCWDIGNVSHMCPTLAPYFQIGSHNLVGHTPEFCVASNSEMAYDTMIMSAKIMGMLALRYATEPDFRASVIANFEQQHKKES